MNRKAITNKLYDILSIKLSDRCYYAREVTIDANTSYAKRVDLMQFSPKGATFASDIEKGIFTCYEVKSCKQDIYSGNGLNFFGEKNYIVTTMQTWKDLQEDYRDGTLSNFIKEKHPESSNYYGIMVAVPWAVNLKNTQEIYAEFENPTPFDTDIKWQMYTIVPCREGPRLRSTTELLFCMLRSKHNYTNYKN